MTIRNFAERCIRWCHEEVLPRAYRARRRVTQIAFGLVALGLSATLGHSDGTTYFTTRTGPMSKSYPDGTSIHLNAKTDALVNVSGPRRTLFLGDGEVQLDIKHGKSVPMDVIIGNVILRDLGTQFDVRKHDNVVLVSVTDGRVQVLEARPDGTRVNPINATQPDPGRDPAYLGAGSLARFELRDGTLLMTQETNNLDEARNRTSWLSGTLLANKEPLDEITWQLNDRSQIKLITDPAVAQRTYGGSFRLDDMDQFLRTARDGLDLEAVPVRDPDQSSTPTYLLRPAPHSTTHPKHHP